MIDLKQTFNLWKDILTKPVETFKKEERNADWGKAVIHLIIAGVIAGFLTGLAVMAGLTAVTGMGGMGAGMIGAGIGAAAFLVSIIVTPLVAVIAWIIVSGILYVFAMIFGAKGDFKNQSYLIALYLAPILVINTIFSLIPIIGPILGFLVMLYGLYLLTMALKQVHKVSTGKAVAIWLVPVLALLVIAALVAAAFITTLMGLSSYAV